jgi:Serine dehydrogenase proteinase
MPSWNEILEEIQKNQLLGQAQAQQAVDSIRREYLRKLSTHTNRNVISIYSAWLQKPNAPFVNIGITDELMAGLMAACRGLDKKAGLDLLLHTPGGEINATEQIVSYLRSLFGTNIRAIVPQIAMSAGTMIALSCKSIVLGLHSNLGPIDPQVGGMPAHAVIEEFEDFQKLCKSDLALAKAWLPIIEKYPPAFVGACRKAIKQADTMVSNWLETGMFVGNPKASNLAKKVLRTFGSHKKTLSHGRHIDLAATHAAGVVTEP